MAHATETTSTIAPSNVRIEADDERKVREDLREFIEEMTKFVEDAEKNIASLMRGLRAKKALRSNFLSANAPRDLV